MSFREMSLSPIVGFACRHGSIIDRSAGELQGVDDAALAIEPSECDVGGAKLGQRPAFHEFAKHFATTLRNSGGVKVRGHGKPSKICEERSR